MRAYRKSYLEKISEKIGAMMDYAVNDCELDGDRFLHMFITSGPARQIEAGSLRAVSSMSGAELAYNVIKSATGKAPAVIPSEPRTDTAEFWAGCALAHYQWYTARTFASIIRYLPYSEITVLHQSLCDSDMAEFCRKCDSIVAERCPQTKLGRIREAAGLTQADLSRKAAVPLRRLQAYEQREKDINKAQAAVLAKLAKALGCAMEDLME